MLGQRLIHLKLPRQTLDGYILILPYYNDSLYYEKSVLQTNSVIEKTTIKCKSDFFGLDFLCFLVSVQLYHSYHTSVGCHLNDGVDDEKGLGHDPGGEGGDQPGHPGRQVDQEGEG